MTSLPSLRRLTPPLAATAGVVAAHAVDYALLFPRTGVRDAHLAGTGHGYWTAAVGIAAAAGAVAAMLVAGRAALDAVRGRRPARGDARLRWGPLAAGQVLAFAVLEVGERALAGVPAAAVFHSAELWLGLILQLPVAWLAVLLLGRLERGGQALGLRLRLRRPRFRSRRAPVRPPAAFPRPRLLAASPAGPRGPPA